LKLYTNEDDKKTQNQKQQHLNVHQEITHEIHPTVKVQQTDPGIHQQKDQEHHHQQERPPHHQEDHAQNKEVDLNNDNRLLHPIAPDHRPNK
jgi:hypothetical protein